MADQQQAQINSPPLSTATIRDGDLVAGDNPPPKIAAAMLSSFLYHVNRIDDLICRDVPPHIDMKKSNLTTAQLHQYMTEKTCPIVRALAKQEQD